MWRGDGYTGPNCSVFAATVRALLEQLASVAGMPVKSLRWGRGGSEFGLQLSDDASVGEVLTVLGAHAAADPDGFSCIFTADGPLLSLLSSSPPLVFFGLEPVGNQTCR